MPERSCFRLFFHYGARKAGRSSSSEAVFAGYVSGTGREKTTAPIWFFFFRSVEGIDNKPIEGSFALCQP